MAVSTNDLAFPCVARKTVTARFDGGSVTFGELDSKHDAFLNGPGTSEHFRGLMRGNEERRAASRR